MIALLLDFRNYQEINILHLKVLKLPFASDFGQQSRVEIITSTCSRSIVIEKYQILVVFANIRYFLLGFRNNESKSMNGYNNGFVIQLK